MQERKLRVALVDDDIMVGMVFKAAMGSAYLLDVYPDGEQLLANIDLTLPDVIILDVQLPGKSGYQICRFLRNIPRFRSTPIIFMSSHDELEAKMAGYDAGADDFIVKPCYPEEMINKIRLAEKLINDRQTLTLQADFASQTAFTAMSSMGELSIVLEFMRAALNCTTPTALATVLVNTLHQYQLQGVIGFIETHDTYFFSTDTILSPLAATLVKNVRDMGRIFEYKNRLAINYPHITIIIHNLPLENPDFVGRLRDNLALIAESAEQKLVLFEQQNRRQQQEQGILKAANALAISLQIARAREQESADKTKQLIQAYLQKFEHNLLSLGLTEAQELFLTADAQDWIAKITTSLEPHSALQNSVLETILQLQELTAEMLDPQETCLK